MASNQTDKVDQTGTSVLVKNVDTLDASAVEDDTEPTAKKIRNITSDVREGEGLSHVVADHYNNVKEVGVELRKESRIYFMRNLNNWIKSMFIEEQMETVREKSGGRRLAVLDLCCGKGGDIKKWLHGPVTHVIFADIAATSVEQCRNRYQTLHNKPFTAEFITADCAKSRLREKMKDVTKQLDLVSCQFAFHYCFESLPQAEVMLKNASECLRTGGRFIGTIPNGIELARRMEEHEHKAFGNEVYTIVPHCKPPYPLFGAKYDFKLEGVVDCPEFLVHFPTLVHLAAKFGLKFIEARPLPAFVRAKKDSGRGLLYRMKGLEKYPGSPELVAPAEQYAHADSHVTDGGHVGTLSASEWEVVSVYMLFVFEKVPRLEWDSQGNPVYGLT